MREQCEHPVYAIYLHALNIILQSNSIVAKKFDLGRPNLIECWKRLASASTFMQGYLLYTTFFMKRPKLNEWRQFYKTYSKYLYAH